MNYLEPESFWEASNLKTHQVFIDKYVVEGKFHKNVPQDIKDAFATVSYLLAFAYYRYQFLDEAVTKTLVVLEMAIKLKAKELNISLDNPPTKKGVVRSKNLGQLVDEVLEELELGFYKQSFHRARNIRNRKVHPDSHTFMGVAGAPKENLQLFVNLINILFLAKEDITLINAQRAKISEGLITFNKKLLVLEKDEKRYLVYKISDFKTLTINTRSITLLVCLPVLNLSERKLEDCSFKAIILELCSVEFYENGISGITFSGEAIKIRITKDERNIDTLKSFKEAYEKEDQNTQFLYNDQLGRSTDWKLQEILYNTCWSS